MPENCCLGSTRRYHTLYYILYIYCIAFELTLSILFFIFRLHQRFVLNISCSNRCAKVQKFSLDDASKAPARPRIVTSTPPCLLLLPRTDTLRASHATSLSPSQTIAGSSLLSIASSTRSQNASKLTCGASNDASSFRLFPPPEYTPSPWRALRF